VFITNIHIGKVRNLENIDINLSDAGRMHLILTGKNGSGKTSLLEAMRENIRLAGLDDAATCNKSPKSDVTLSYSAPDVNLVDTIMVYIRNFRSLFQIDETRQSNDEGVFSVGEPIGETEELLLQRCKESLSRCEDFNVDLAIFPEMLFTDYIQKNVQEFVRNLWSERMPWFIWLGSAWANRTNKCMVIDRYGKQVLEHRKHTPYEYKVNGIKYCEDLKQDDRKSLHLIDVPDMFRIGTAICRDITNDNVTTLAKELLSDMMIIPSFSKVDGISDAHIKPMIIEKIITIVCNACSALCDEDQISLNIGKDRIGQPIDFCYLGMPKKEETRNQVALYPVSFSESCLKCEQTCLGCIFSISFDEYDEGMYTSKVTYI